MAVAPRSAASAGPGPDPTSHHHASAETDTALLERWQAGDRDAGSRLVRKHHASIAGFFGSSVRDGEQQDLTQKTFERITRGKGYFHRDCSVRSCFLRVARGVLLDYLRRRRRKDFDPLTHSVEDVDALSPSRVVAELGRTRKLLLCLRGLPMDAKQMLELYYWQGCTAAELGAIFEVPEGTIRRRVFNAKARLRACLFARVQGEDEWVGLEQHIRELGELLAVGPAPNKRTGPQDP